MASVDELDTLLQSLQALKPPGVSKSKIETINTLCIVNVGSDSTIVEKIVANFQSAPSTHKLGVLYAVDSVTRQWIEKARQTGQALIGSAAAPGTYASGVHKMTGVLPTMMNELIITAPANQKDKIAKLIDIWDKASTFPADMLGDFKRRLEGPAQSMRTFPPSETASKPDPNQATQSATNGHAAAQNVSTVTPAASAQPTYPQYQAPAPAPPPAVVQPAVQPQQAAGLAADPNLSYHFQSLSLPQPAPNAVAAAPPQPAAQAMPVPNPAEFLVNLAAGGMPAEQLAQVAAALGLPLPPALHSLPGAAPPPVLPPGAPNAPPMQGFNGSSYQQPLQPGNDNNEYKRPHSRSRSPDFKRRRVTPPNRRESPVYGVYDPEAGQSETHRGNDYDRRGRNNRGGRDRGHRRSPPGRQPERAPSPRQMNIVQGSMIPKNIKFDASLPNGSIKVLSRTLFVGGVAASEREIRDIFSRFGRVQTCIVNLDKRHAFVKMVDRKDALNAKAGMEYIKDPEVLNKARSTRWGVGFGPRECSDYGTGVSVVPISALTEADKRWLLTAEYGGTGGQPLESGMVVEEPDIEIGAGVSSKAISRRIETSVARRQDRGPAHAHRPAPQTHHQDRYGYDRPANPPRQENYQPRYREPAPEPARAKAPPQILKPEPNTVGVPPAVPGFGFQLPGMNFR